MIKRGLFLLFIFSSFLSVAQTMQGEYQKGKGGMQYKIISNNKGQQLLYGNYMKLEYATYYNNGREDSVLIDSRIKGIPMIQRLDSVSATADYVEILLKLRKGDSLAVSVLVDSAYNSAAPENRPPFFEDGHYIITTVRLLDIFTTESEAQAAIAVAKSESDQINARTLAEQPAREEEILTKFFKKNNITAARAPKGTYINIINNGKGNNASPNDVVKVNYTGHSFNGKVFDSNTDSSFGHLLPLYVNLSKKGAVIEGWEEGLLYLNKGSKAILYIPSALGYGVSGNGAIGPNEILVFDIEILSIEPAPNVKPVEKRAKTFDKPKKAGQ